MKLLKKLAVLFLATFSGYTAVKSAQAPSSTPITTNSEGGGIWVQNLSTQPVEVEYLKNGKIETTKINAGSKILLGKAKEVEDIAGTLPSGTSANFYTNKEPGPKQDLIFQIIRGFPPVVQVIDRT